MLRLALGLIVLAMVVGGRPAFGQAPPTYFAETGHTLTSDFAAYWQAHGGLAQQGFPISEEFSEINALDGKPYQVQYFERAVFERHAENAPPFDVLLSQLGTFRYLARYPAGAPGQAASTENARLFPETGKTLGGTFRAYWESHGGLAQQGFPISDEFAEKSDLNSQTYIVQYFERAVFEWHPENAPPYDVLLSQLGTFQQESRYPNGSNPAAARVPAPGESISLPTPTAVAATAVPTIPGGQGYVAGASVSNANPSRRETITIFGTLSKDGQPVAGARMHVTLHFKSTTSYCDDGITDATGRASCMYNIGGATLGYTVVTTVQFLDAGGAVLVAAATSFTPR